ncbi:MAG: hypothetical protein PHF84_04270 [bacterium]|nr:hypothetical protein [bacterium]
MTARLADVESGAVVSETVSIDKSQMLETRDKLLDMAFVQKMGVGISINPAGQTSMDGDLGSWRNIGAEIKYRFTKNIMIGMGVEMYGADVYKNPALAWRNLEGNPSYTNGRNAFTITANGIGFPMSLYLVLNPSRRLNISFSGGAEILILKINGFFDSDVPQGGGGSGFGENNFGPSLDSFMVIGIARLGIEYFLTPRMALAIRVGYDFGTLSLDLNPMWHLQPELPKTMDAKLSGLFFGPSISFYF